ncbi:mechanosensitive ion channel family protein [Caryophanon tenue]|uniref:Mechanosensitive ion channel protein MscS n=1 Tax=Caryophanon tenue TaxID=33978 RepID=A0A1C0YL49_9BACL|nr:mechanosensitive ion channel family protein [Caryophanon tenue]OCS87906.1 mechanosensitive ion channel protein MscS [Caryophanon tenue]
MDVQGLIQRWTDYLMSPQLWDKIGSATLEITLILIVSAIVVPLVKSIIARVFKLRRKTPLRGNDRRDTTILKLLQNIVVYLVYFSAIVGILSSMGIQVAGLLAGAGVAGLAIGFGAQSLVKDVITGFFIIFEDQFGVGDYIKLTGGEGTVVEIGLRTTKIQGPTGEQYIIPNGGITNVTNYSVNNTNATIDLDVPVNADIETVQSVIQEYLNTLPQTHEELVRAPQFIGVVNFNSTEATVRITYETLPRQSGPIGRVIRRDVISIFAGFGFIATDSDEGEES